MERISSLLNMRNIPYEPLIEDEDEYEEQLARDVNNQVGHMDKRDGIDCPICKNKGYIAIWDRKTKTRLRPDCECWPARESIRRLNRLDICRDWQDKTFAVYQAADSWQRIMKERVLRYVQDDAREWLYVSGQSGCGKTHLCTAAFVELVKRNCLRGEYVRWMDMTAKLDALRFNDKELELYRHRLTTCDILYIDDLFKKRRNTDISEREFDNTLSVVDARYKNPELLTIISGERTMEELRGMDEALAGRIHERCGRYIVQIKQENGRNYRTRKIEMI